MRRVLNIGSLNYDRCYQVADFVKAKETVSALGYTTHLGGKGLNQSVALARAGAAVSHAGAVGAEDGAALLEYLNAAGVDVSRVQRLDGPSGHAIIQINPQGQNCILIFGGANMCLGEADIDQVLSDFSPGDILLLQNETSCLAYAMERAKALGLYIALNPSPINETLLRAPLHLADCLILNEVEGAALADGETEFEQILDRLAQKYPRCAVVLTLGGDGCLYRAGETRLAQPAFPARAVDTTAAGDTFTGYFLAGLARGDSPAACLQIAARAAAIAVTRPGAAPSIPCREELEN